MTRSVRFDSRQSGPREPESFSGGEEREPRPGLPGMVIGAFQPDAFQNNAFQMALIIGEGIREPYRQTFEEENMQTGSERPRRNGPTVQTGKRRL